MIKTLRKVVSFVFLSAWGGGGGGGGDGVGTPPPILGTTSPVSAGSFYTVDVKSDGTVWAWGYSNYGQLGDGTTTDRFTPVQVW